MRKTHAVVALCVAVGLLLVYPLALYAAAWYERLRAERLLAAITSLHVGTTTEAEYNGAIYPVVGSSDRLLVGNTNQSTPGAFGITSLPEWMYISTLHLPAPIKEVFDNWGVAEGTIFMVIPTFKDGTLTALSISEAQASGPHPLGGSVTIHAGQLRYLRPEDTILFSGYYGRAMSTEEKVIHSFVDFDDRATVEERRRALNFRFSCFTSFSPCHDGRQMLDPIMTTG